MAFPLLPNRPEDEPWSANVLHAFDLLWTAHQKSNEILQLSTADPMRLQIHIYIIIKDVIPILQALESSQEEEEIPEEWIREASITMLTNYDKLKDRVKHTKGQCVTRNMMCG